MAMFKFPHNGKRVVAHPLNKNMVIVPGKGDMTRATAEYLGYTLPTESETAQTARDAKTEQFTSLPEAAGKIRSAARLAADYPDMTAEQGRRFLRGAPTDAAISAQRQTTATTTTAAPEDPRAARLAEIRRLGKRR